MTGAAVMAGGTPAPRTLLIAALYSLGAHGIMTLNDFKSIEGDRKLGLGSLPVRLGAERAGRVACLAMALPQFVVVALLAAWGEPYHALAVAASLGLQMACMVRLLKRSARTRPLVQRHRREPLRARHAGERLCAARGDDAGRQ